MHNISVHKILMQVNGLVEPNRLARFRGFGECKFGGELLVTHGHCSIVCLLNAGNCPKIKQMM